MIAVGDAAPAFDLPAAGGGRVRLADLLERGPAVVFFYPKDDTPGCTAEVCSFRDAFSAFSEIGASVVGISSDTAASHEQFRAKYGLPFVLASDPGGTTRKSFGVPKTFGLIPGRVTYVIDRDGIVRSIFSSQFSPQKHVDAALGVVQTLV